MLDRKSGGFISANPPAPTQASAQGVWDGNQQIVAQLQNAWPLPPHVVQRSLRFNSADSANLTRTFTATGDQTRWTWSGWVKRGALGVTQGLIWRNNPGATPHGGIRFEGTNVITVGTDRGGTNYWFFGTTAVFRDPSAWYHIVVVLNTSEAVQADRCKIYVNGVQQTTTITSGNSTPSLNDTMGGFNSNVQHNIGALDSTANAKFDGYMAEVNFIDGQALTPSSFGETDPQTGIWVPKRYTGTYGTNGFRLPFSNNSSTTALGFDASGNGNNWTPNNFSVTPGSGNDSLLDVPSLYGATDTGIGGEVRGNYATWNPALPAFSGIISLSNGALDATTGTGGTTGQSTYATFAVSSGRWYWEATFGQSGSSSFEAHIGWATAATDNSNLAYAYLRGGQKVTLGTLASYGASFTANDVIGVALDMDAGTMTFYKNGVSQGTAFTGLTGTLIPTARVIREASYTSAWYANFGQRPFAFPAPAGFKALCTTNLVVPAIGQTAANRAGNHFNVVTYTGNGAASRSITGVGFQPDLVWIKSRTNASGFHILVDSVRGAGLWLAANSTNVESSAGQLVSSLDADGFSLNLNPNNTVNETNANYVAWCWNAGGNTVTNSAGSNGATIASTYRANKAAGFSVVTYTGNGVDGATVAHGLGAAPAFIIAKSRGNAFNWGVWHKNLAKYDANHAYAIGLNVTRPADATAQYAVFYPGVNTANVFGLGNEGTANQSNATYVAYCFAEVPGFSAFGSYTGNSSADGAFVYTGFRPAFILIKDISTANSWVLMDNKRTAAYNPQDGWLVAQASDAEYNVSTSDSRIDFLSNGFKLRNSNAGNNGSRTYIYAAFAEAPFRLSSAR